MTPLEEANIPQAGWFYRTKGSRKRDGKTGESLEEKNVL
jgi:hypothetical protein